MKREKNFQKEKYFEEVKEAVRNKIPEELRDEIIVNTQEVIKTNDQILHGISLKFPGRESMPTFYMEDFYSEYKAGRSAEEIADIIIRISIESYKTAPEFENIPLNYEEIKDKLVLQMVDEERNKDRLKDLVYKPVSNGFVMIPYIVIKTDCQGSMRTVITKAMASEYEYNIEILMEQAFINTMKHCEPVFMGICDIINMVKTYASKNPMKADFKIERSQGMYVLTNSARHDGATTLFYPGLMKRIGEIIDDNYYVLPSSIHELILVPKAEASSVGELQERVKEINSTVVDPREVLCDRVLLYDRKKDQLIETAEENKIV